ASISDDETFSIYRGDAAQEICEIEYDVYEGGTPVGYVDIDKITYTDYFKVEGKELAVPAK
ncbi:MAG: hypothetical protein J6Z11_15120, partial [Candidatus Riflebacteria bacterium]|nr:hypothetical protein [Candidatus Riflebacteria bacterium]